MTSAVTLQEPKVVKRAVVDEQPVIFERTARVQEPISHQLVIYDKQPMLDKRTDQPEQPDNRQCASSWPATLSS